MTIERPSRETRNKLQQPPTFQVSYSFDDDDDPSRIMLFSETTSGFCFSWITADADYAVDIGEAV